MRVSLFLFLLLFLTGCGALRPLTVQIPQYIPRPEACARKHAVELPDGSTAMMVIERQASAIKMYEVQVETCYQLPRSQDVQ